GLPRGGNSSVRWIGATARVCISKNDDPALAETGRPSRTGGVFQRRCDASVNDDASRAPKPVLTGEERRGHDRAKAASALQIERLPDEHGPLSTRCCGH